MNVPVQIESVSVGNQWASPLGLIERWGPTHSAAAVVCLSRDGVPTAFTTGPAEMAFPWASVTKLLTTLTILIAVEEKTVSLHDTLPALDGSLPDDEAITVEMLLAHASGVQPDVAQRMTAPLGRRVYSNAGIRLAAQHLEQQAGMPFGEYCREAVLGPLGMTTTFISDPAAGAAGPLTDLIRLTTQFMAPTLISPATLADASRPHWPLLEGVLPGFGKQSPNPWGLGFEIRGNKTPHWTGSTNSPHTFGHFGQSGSMLWIDPIPEIGVCALSSDPFGPWAQSAWPQFSDAVLAVGSHQSMQPLPFV
jgi:CubicO group peptidase (beta-lactamase class C family)